MTNTLNTKATKSDLNNQKTIIENPDVKVIEKNLPQQILSNFKIETKNFLEYLIKIKKELNNLPKEKIELSNSLIINFFQTLDAHFLTMWHILKNDLKFNELTENSNIKYQTHKDYYQQLIQSFFMDFDLGFRSYTKPCGYAGDYKLINYYYEKHSNFKTSFDKALDLYTIMHTPCGQSVQNRKKFIVNFINNIQNNRKKLSILSIGSGPAQEIVEFCSIRETNKNNIKITLLDLDDNALNYAKTKLSKFINKNTKISFINLNILNLLYNKSHFQSQDIIYSIGLFDYFNDVFFKKCAKILYDKLQNNGYLIIGNISSSNPHRSYMALLAEWYLIYRDKKHLFDLANECGFQDYKISSDTTGVQLFLIIHKNDTN